VKYLYCISTFLLLVALDFYLKSNVIRINEGSTHLQILGWVFFIGGLLVIWRCLISSSVLIKRSTSLLVLFVVHFVFRVGIDTGSLEELKASMLATTGGIMLFYGLGFVVATSIGQSFTDGLHSRNHLKAVTWLFVFYIVLSSGFLYTCYIDLSVRLRSDIFLISGLEGAYQRPGDFLVISFLILTTLYVQVIAINQTVRSRIYRFIAPTLFMLYVAYGGMSILISQMIGSNKAAVLIAGLTLVLLVVYVLVMSRNVSRYMASRYLNIRKVLLGVIGRKLVLAVIISGVFLITSGVIVASVLEIDLTLTRLGGFGSGENSSVSSRISLLNNFSSQFNYAPLFGNMNVDTLTTGTGSYAHSFLLSSLTHTGLLGFILIVGYFILAYQERFKLITFDATAHSQSLLAYNIFNLYSVMAFSVILLIGVVGTFFTWSVIWFAMGLLLVAVRFEVNKRVNDEF